MATEVVHSIRSSGGDYTSLSAWEAAQQRDLVTADEIAVAELYNDWSGDGLLENCELGAWTTDTTRRIIIRAADGEKHDGTPGTGARIYTQTGYDEPLTTNNNNVTISGIESKVASGANSYALSIRSNKNDTIVESCILTQTNSAKGLIYNYRNTFTIYGSLLLCTNGAGVWAGSSYTPSAYFENCTLVQTKSTPGGNALSIGHSDTVYIKNCVVYGNWAADLVLSATRDATCEVDTNATSFSSGTSGFDDTESDVSNSIYDLGDEFLNAASDDYRIDSTAASLYDAGIDLGTASDYIDLEGFSFQDTGGTEHWPIGASRGVVEVVKTIRASLGDYTSHTAWESGEQKDLTAVGEIAIGRFYDDWASGLALGESWVIGGWTTDERCYIKIDVASGNQHDGIDVESGFFFTSNNNWQGIDCEQDFTRFENLAFKPAHNAASILSGTSDIVRLIDRCFVDASANSNDFAGFLLGNPDDATGAKYSYAVSCLFIGNTAASQTGFNYGNWASQGESVFYNCVAVDCNIGFEDGNEGLGSAINCIAYNCTTDFASGASNTTYYKNNATDKTSAASNLAATGANNVFEITSADFENTAIGDYHLSASSSLIDAGLNLYDEGDLTPPIYDIDGEAMPSAGSEWCIGADWRAGAGGDPLTAATETDSAVTLVEAVTATPLTAATETDAAVTLSASLVDSLAVATETDAAVALVEQVIDALTAATETDAGATLSASLVDSLAVATETDAAVALVEQVIDALTAATEVDGAVTLSASLSASLATATETDTAAPLSAAVSAALTAAAEVDAAEILLPASGALPLGVAAEVDQAVTLATKTKLQAATETDTAVTLSAADVLALAVAGETDSALTLNAALRKALAAALEIDAAVILAGQAAISAATETDTAVPLVATGTHAFITGNHNRWVLTPRGTTFTLDARSPVFDYAGGDSQSAKFRGRDTE